MWDSRQTCLFDLNIALQTFVQYICSMQKIKLSTNMLNFAVLLKLGHGIWLPWVCEVVRGTVVVHWCIDTNIWYQVKGPITTTKGLQKANVLSVCSSPPICHHSFFRNSAFHLFDVWTTCAVPYDLQNQEWLWGLPTSVFLVVETSIIKKNL